MSCKQCIPYMNDFHGIHGLTIGNISNSSNSSGRRCKHIWLIIQPEFKHWQEQRKIIEITNFDMEDHEEITHTGYMCVMYGIWKVWQWSPQSVCSLLNANWCFHFLLPEILALLAVPIAENWQSYLANASRNLFIHKVKSLSSRQTMVSPTQLCWRYLSLPLRRQQSDHCQSLW